MMTRDALERVLWRIVRIAFAKQDEDWLRAFEADHHYMPEALRLKFLASGILAGLRLRFDRCCASYGGRLFLTLSGGVFFLVAGCFILRVLFPSSPANWFISCNPHLSPFDKLLGWQQLTLSLSLFALINISLFASRGQPAFFYSLSLLTALALIVAILVSMTTLPYQPTARAAGVSTFHWMIFILYGNLITDAGIRANLRRL